MTGSAMGLPVRWTAVVSAALLAASAAAAAKGSRTATRDRLKRLTPLPQPAARPARRMPFRTVAVLAGVAVALVIGGWVGVAIGAVAAVVADRSLRRIEPQSVRSERDAARADLPFAADLIAAALLAGAPIDRALLMVASAVGGPFGERLRRVGRTIALGTAPRDAWAVFADLPEAGPLVRAAVRASESGAALAAAFTRCAAVIRATRDAEADAAAHRAGVLVVLPLGCCFLPAFVLVGIVPTVLGVLRAVLR